MYERSDPALLHSCQHLVLSLFSFSHSNGCIVVSHCGLIFISFKASDIEYIFMSVFAICLSSSVKCLSFAHFLIGFGHGGASFLDVANMQPSLGGTAFL